MNSKRVLNTPFVNNLNPERLPRAKLWGLGHAHTSYNDVLLAGGEYDIQVVPNPFSSHMTLHTADQEWRSPNFLRDKTPEGSLGQTFDYATNEELYVGHAAMQSIIFTEPMLALFVLPSVPIKRPPH